jgi:predicted RNase H-like HicB family nuclease
MKDHHINIFYSDEHDAYVADIPDLAIAGVPELERCFALGQTPNEALARVEEKKRQWLEIALGADRGIPEPHYHPEIYDFVGAPGAAKPLEATTVDADHASYEKHLAYIRAKIAQHQCVLFLGSAIHAPSPAELPQFNYPREKAPPIGSQLSQLLARESGYPAPDWWNLQRVAQHYEKTYQRYGLVDAIKNQVTEGREPSPILRMLADMEFPIVITTNYDHLYEQALDRKAEAEKAAGKTVTKYKVSVFSPNLSEKLPTIDCDAIPDPKQPYILKIHGDIDKRESIVLTDEDYIQFLLRMSDQEPYYPFGDNVLGHLMKWSTLFVGYSLMDYNLRLLFKTLRWKLDASQIPPTFSVDKKPDVLIRDVWESQRRYVSFIVLNLWDCIPKLHADLGKEPLS